MKLEKVLIIGESNSVFNDGWVSGFKDVAVTVSVDNRSIGSSGIFNVIRILSELDNFNYDLIIIDTFIQDALFFSNDPDFYRYIFVQLLNEVVGKCNCRVAYILFSGRRALNKNIQNILFDECFKLGVFIFDTSKWLGDYCYVNGDSIDDLYLDESHPLPNISYSIGSSFYKSLLENWDFIPLAAVVPSDSAFLYFDKKNIDASNFLGLNSEISNSLVNFNSMLLNAPEHFIKISLDHSNFIPLGVYYNSSTSNGLLKIRCDDNFFLKNLTSGSFSKNGKIVWARPFKKLFNSSSGRDFVLSLSNYHNSIEFETTEYADNYFKSDFEGLSLEIVSIVFVDLLKLFKGCMPSLNISSLIKAIELSDSFCGFLNRSRRGQELVLSKIYSDGLINLAKKSLASQSSLSQFSSSEGASGGCNGIINGKFGFHTSLEFNPWWSLDFGSVKSIRFIVIYNRIDAASDRVSKMKISLSADNTQWDEIFNQVDKSIFGGCSKNNGPLVISLRNAIDCRYLKVELVDYNFLHLDEVEVY